jgi:hypothetical protein
MPTLADPANVLHAFESFGSRITFPKCFDTENSMYHMHLVNEGFVAHDESLRVDVTVVPAEVEPVD